MLRIVLNIRKSHTEVMTVLEQAGSTFVWFPLQRLVYRLRPEKVG